MKVLDSPQPDTSEHPDADALIEEARQRQRKRRLFAAAAVLIVAVASGVWVSSNGGSVIKPPSTSRKPGHTKSPTSTPGSARGTTSSATWNPSAGLNEVSCAETTCVAIGYSGQSESVPILEGLTPEIRARVLYSTDDGASWRVAALPSGVAELTDVVCSTVARCVATGESATPRSARLGLVLVSLDRGASWTRAFVPAGTPPLVTMSCGDVTWCVAAGSNDVIVSFDGGQSWSRATALIPTNGTLLASGVSCVDGGFCLGIGRTGVFASTDYGRTWRLRWVPPYVTESAHPTGILCVARDDCILGIALNFRGELWLSTDGGRKWVVPSGGIPTDAGPVIFQTQSISCAPGGRCLAVGDVGPGLVGIAMAVSADDGHSWSQVGYQMEDQIAELGGSKHWWLTAGGVSCSSARVCLEVGQVDFDRISVARTLDGALRWSSVKLPACATGRCSTKRHPARS